ncbi:nitronate monooxygenase [Burkholderia anthina]|uniref:nitronate monooxygenase n=1 Tax=Burkholderia anthina TaxID=179879 RepID=UPI0009C01452
MHEWSSRRISKLPGIALLMIQARMDAPVSTVVTAVSESREPGALWCICLSTAEVGFALQAVRLETSRPTNVDFNRGSMPGRSASYSDEPSHLEVAGSSRGVGRGPQFVNQLCEAAEAFRPAVGCFVRGLPNRIHTDRIRTAGMRSVLLAGLIRQARWLWVHGCDTIVAAGIESGFGEAPHGCVTSVTPLRLGGMALIPKIADAIRQPMIAAGGISDAQGMVRRSVSKIGAACLCRDEAVSQGRVLGMGWMTHVAAASRSDRHVPAGLAVMRRGTSGAQ